MKRDVADLSGPQRRWLQRAAVCLVDAGFPPEAAFEAAWQWTVWRRYQANENPQHLGMEPASNVAAAWRRGGVGPCPPGRAP